MLMSMLSPCAAAAHSRSLIHSLGITATFALVTVTACAPITPKDGTETPTSRSGAAQPQITEEKQCAPGVRAVIDQGIRTLHLKGNYRDLGYQHGKLAAAEISAMIDGYVVPYVESLGGREMFDVAGEVLFNTLSEAEQDEIKGLAEGSGRTQKDIVLLNTFNETASSLAGREGHVLPLNNAVMGVDPRASRSGSSMLGGTFEITPFNGSYRPELMAITFHPPAGKPFIVFTIPGMIGGYAGMNLDGLAYFASNVPGPLGLKPTVPFAVVCRRMVAQNHNVEAAAQFILKSDISTAHNLMMADVESRVWTLECTTERIAIRKNMPNDEAGKHVLYCVNHFIDSSMATQQIPPGVASLQREQQIKTAMADLKELYWANDKFMAALSSASIKRNLQAAVVFFPKERVLYISSATDADKGKPFRKLVPQASYGLLAPEIIRNGAY